MGPKALWAAYEKSVEGEEAYQAVKKNTSGSRPKEIFDDVLEDLSDEYAKAKVWAQPRVGSSKLLCLA